METPPPNGRSTLPRTLLVVGVLCIFGGESFCIFGPIRYQQLIHVVCHIILYSGIALVFVGGLLHWSGDVHRWLYRGRRPNWIARMANRTTAVVASWGVTSNYMETLEVHGRKSRRIASLPVVIAVVDGQRYLVSMLGDNAQWVPNVRAAGGKAALVSGRREEIELEEIPAAQRAPILKAYLQRAPGARPHVPVDKDAPLAEFERIAAEFPVFRVLSRNPEQPTLSQRKPSWLGHPCEKSELRFSASGFWSCAAFWVRQPA